MGCPPEPAAAVSLESTDPRVGGRTVTDQMETTKDWPQVDPAVSPTAAIYMLRTVQQHHVQLSVMADVKASILITAASIMVTAFVALTSSIGLEPGIVAAAPLVLASLGLAIFAVLPKASPNAGPEPDSADFNLFFFAHFGSLSSDEFADQMMSIIGDPKEIYLRQIKDIYQLGTYLRTNKYRYLRLAYLALFLGVVLGMTTEVVAYIL